MQEKQEKNDMTTGWPHRRMTVRQFYEYHKITDLRENAIYLILRRGYRWPIPLGLEECSLLEVVEKVARANARKIKIDLMPEEYSVRDRGKQCSLIFGFNIREDYTSKEELFRYLDTPSNTLPVKIISNVNQEDKKLLRKDIQNEKTKESQAITVYPQLIPNMGVLDRHVQRAKVEPPKNTASGYIGMFVPRPVEIIPDLKKNDEGLSWAFYQKPEFIEFCSFVSEQSKRDTNLLRFEKGVTTEKYWNSLTKRGKDYWLDKYKIDTLSQDILLNNHKGPFG
jgi:hypothetical protein